MIPVCDGTGRPIGVPDIVSDLPDTVTSADATAPEAILAEVFAPLGAEPAPA